MRRVAVTGVSGNLGLELAERLERADDVEAMLSSFNLVGLEQRIVPVGGSA